MHFGQHLDAATPGSWRSTLIGGVAALTLLLTQGLAGAQTNGTEKNIAAQVQQDAPVALPSLNPLVERVSCELGPGQRRRGQQPRPRRRRGDQGG